MNANTRLRMLIAAVLKKVHFVINTLASLRDVPVILDNMVLRLIFLEYAIAAWRYEQRPEGQFKANGMAHIIPHTTCVRLTVVQDLSANGDPSSPTRTCTSPSETCW